MSFCGNHTGADASCGSLPVCFPEMLDNKTACEVFGLKFLQPVKFGNH